MVELQVGDELEIAEVAGKQGEVVCQGGSCDQEVHVANLLPEITGQTAAEDGELLGHCHVHGQEILPIEKVTQPSHRCLRIAREVGTLMYGARAGEVSQAPELGRVRKPRDVLSFVAW